MTERKHLWELLQPDIIVSGTVLHLSPTVLQERQIQGVIFDVDDTLVPLASPTVSLEIVSWLDQMRQFFQIWLVSNNISHSRISQIAASLKAPHIHRAGKPSRRALRRAIVQMQLPPERVAIVGDRLLTDILAGNRLGLLTVLVTRLPAPTKGIRVS